MIKYIKNLFSLPTPIQLGYGSDCLALRCITPETKEKTWEDYDKELKSKFPIKVFLFKTLPFLFRIHITMNLEHWWYWIDSFLLKKEHLLDLRQPDIRPYFNDYYRWGYASHYDKLLYAQFNILNDFVENYLDKFDYDYDINPDESWVKEAKEIYRWWNFERKNFQVYLDSFEYEDTEDCIKSNNADIELHNKTIEMCIRLNKIAHYMR